MKKKSVLLIAMIAVMALSFTAGCGRNKDSSSDSSSDVNSGIESDSSDISPEPENVYFKVTFSGDGVEQREETVKKGESVLEPNDPIREGYHFEGWFVGDATTPFDFESQITGDVTLVARWSESADIPGKGTKEDPFRICNATQLISFSDRVNEFEEGFYNGYFVLTSDIDMKGVNTDSNGPKYRPAGKLLVLNEGEENEDLIYGFNGFFDGQGHKISNLSFDRRIKKDLQYVGLFGLTGRAGIYNLTLENIDYRIEGNSDSDTLGASVGGLVGAASGTSFENIKVTGKVRTCMLPKNRVMIGGIGGVSQNYGDTGVLKAFSTINCYVNLETTIEEDADGMMGVLENAYIGGLFGNVINSDCIMNIINCKVDGKIFGGKESGGLIGGIANYVSIQDCVSTANVEVTSEDHSYAGGLVGGARGDCIIVDSYASGLVKGKKSVDNGFFSSYAGGLVGYSAEDSYEYGYEPGLCVINSYYSGTARNTDNVNKIGQKVEKTVFTKDWMLNTLRWNDKTWIFEKDNFYPSNVVINAIDLPIKLTLMSNNEVHKEVDMTITKEKGYGFINGQERLENNAPNLFWAWEFENGNFYRFYLPMIKDVTLTAKWQDVTEISKMYSGRGKLDSASEWNDAGIIILKDNGELEWISESIVIGNYIYDGQNILLTIESNMGNVYGSIIDGKFNFNVDVGMSGSVMYEFSEYTDTALVGEYFSSTGDILTFGKKGKVSFQREGFQNDSYLRGDYTEKGNIFTVKGLRELFSEFKMELLQDGSIKVNAKSKDGSVTLTNEIFSKIENIDFSKEKYIGEYNYASISSSSGVPYQQEYVISFGANGSLSYKNMFGTTMGRAYYFKEHKLIKVMLEGYVSTLYYDEENDIILGNMNRGSLSNNATILTRKEDGKLRGYVIEENKSVVFVNDKTSYLFVDGKIIPNTVITGEFKNDSRVTVNGSDYYVKEGPLGHNYSYALSKIGKEEGKYTYNDLSINIDGIGNVTGTCKGIYVVYDNFMVVVLDDDTIIGFDYMAAKNNGNKITKADSDQYQGVWYIDKNTHNDAGESVVIKKHYKFVIDGYGHTTLFYLNDDNTYHYNWATNWVAYSKTTTGGIYCKFNDMQEATVDFYYNYQLAYSKHFGYLGEQGFYKDGFEGPFTPPEFPLEYVGSYVDKDTKSQKLEIRGDISGTYLGNPFVGIYNGIDTIYFTIEKIEYSMVFKDKNTFTLNYSGKSIEFNKTSETVEKIPAVIAGIWKGKTTAGSSVIDVTYDISTDGTVLYNGNKINFVSFDPETNMILGNWNGGEFNNFQEIKLTWNSGDNTLSIIMVDVENRSYEGVLTKNV